jgi:MOSC domain-containing protein YiiM
VPTVASVQIGTPSRYDDDGGAPFDSAIGKQPVSGRVQLTALGLDGDVQVDKVHHGGPDKALCVYPAHHLPVWSERLSTPMPAGAFGENLTVAGQDETDVCVGDVFAIGDVRVEVSQPRQPCFKLARRWGQGQLALWVQQSGKVGWYLRVLTPGTLGAGDTIERLAQPYPQWTIAKANALMFSDGASPDEQRALAACDKLFHGWREALLTKADRADAGRGRADPAD